MTIEKLLLTGGVTRPFSGVLGEAYYSKYGVLGQLDLSSSAFEVLLRHDASRSVTALGPGATHLTSGTRTEDRLYLCSRTEVMIYHWPGLRRIRRISHPWFNDVHHVTEINGELFVASTGLDAILRFDLNGQLLSAHHALGYGVWYRRDPDVDYRKVANTKPHDSHPNYIFSLEGNVWVTRFEQKDAARLDDLNEKIALDVERVHDGHLINGKLYFTSVNGCIIIVDPQRRRKIDVIDLNEIDDRGKPLGWCRGIHVAGDIAYVGFSKLRSTRFEKNLRWVKNLATGRTPDKEPLPARIAAYDIAERKLLKEFVLPEDAINTVFSILPS